MPHSSHIHPHHPSHTHPPQMNNSTGNNSNAPFARVPSAGGLPTLPGMNSSVSGQEDSNFPPGRILNQILIYSHILHQDQQMKIISKLHITPK